MKSAFHSILANSIVLLLTKLSILMRIAIQHLLPPFTFSIPILSYVVDAVDIILLSLSMFSLSSGAAFLSLGGIFSCMQQAKQ